MHKVPATRWAVRSLSLPSHVALSHLLQIAKAAIPLLLIVMMLSSAPGVRLCWVLFLNSQILSQEFHKLSHTVNPPSYVKWLQNQNIILSRKVQSPITRHPSLCHGHLTSLAHWRRPYLIPPGARSSPLVSLRGKILHFDGDLQRSPRSPPRVAALGSSCLSV